MTETSLPKIARRKPLAARVGIYAVGHHVYWDQFAGLKDQLLQDLADFEKKVVARGVETINFGLVDEARGAYRVVEEMKRASLDLLFVDMVTYATSSTFGIVCRELDIPIVLVALQPMRDFNLAEVTTATQLRNDNICSLPEFTGVAARMGRKLPLIIGSLHDDPAAEAEIDRFCRVARVLHDVKGARVGHMGHALEAMLDMHSDPTAFTTHFGLHIVQTEPDDVLKHLPAPDQPEVKAKADEILSFFDTPEPGIDPDTLKLTDEDLTTAARVYAALERFIDEEALDGLAYYYEALPESLMRTVVTNFIVGNSILTAAGFPMCGESDLKTCLAMLIFDRLDIGGSFAEFHPVNFQQNYVLVGHDGPHHLNVANARPVLRSLKQYHGKPGHGASVEFKLKEGPITMLSINHDAEGGFKFIVAEGISQAGEIPATGNTNTRGVFGEDLVGFLQDWFAEGPTHHFALGIGHEARTIAHIADALGVECAVVRTES
jgi:L-arabinose isomerase